jgi:23S rRNA (cytosine1962-C5)-methyltransferase
MPQPRLILRKGREQRQLQGHPWVYEGEIARVKGTPRDGGVADCYSHDDVFLGRGYFNSRSKIRLRVLTRHIAEDIDDALLRRRLVAALGRRRRLYPEATSLRLVHSEGDGLPGLTVDRYGSALVLQYASMGLDRRRETIERLLQELTGLDRLYARNDLAPRRLDGLELGKGFVAAPFETTVSIEMHQVTLEVDVAGGHKTGFYLDQADNYLALGALAPTAGTVLDAFCYTGAFSLHAAAAGAGEVLGVDSSTPTLEQARRNAELNGLGDRCQFESGNVFNRLRHLQRQGRRFDVVVLDPPAFTHQRGTVDKALDGYKEINLQALKLLRQGGVLLTFSCSHHISRERFEAMVQEAARDARRQLIVRQRLGQAAHHPEVMAIPETSYLKGFAVESW